MSFWHCADCDTFWHRDSSDTCWLCDGPPNIVADDFVYTSSSQLGEGWTQVYENETGTWRTFIDGSQAEWL